MNKPLSQIKSDPIKIKSETVKYIFKCKHSVKRKIENNLMINQSKKNLPIKNRNRIKIKKNEKKIKVFWVLMNKIIYWFKKH